MIPERELVIGVGFRAPDPKKGPQPVLVVYAGHAAEECEAALLAAIDSGAIFYARAYRGWSSIPFFAASFGNRPPVGPAEVFPATGRK